MSNGLKQAIWINAGYRGQRRFVLFLAFAFASLVGYVTFLVGLVGGVKPSIMAALPAALVLGFAFLINRGVLLAFILIFRASLDPFLEATKLPLGGSSMGLGGVLNGLIILIALAEIGRVFPAWLKRAMVVSLPLFALVLIGVFRSEAPGEAAKIYLSLLTNVAIFAVGAIKARELGGRYVPVLVACACAIAVLITIVMMVSGVRLSYSGERLAGPFSHPNVMAFVMVTSLVACLYLRANAIKGVGQCKAGDWQLVSTTVALGSLLLILLSQTRSAWAATLLILVTYSALFERKLLPLLLACMISVVFLPQFQDRILDLKDDRGYLIYSRVNSYEWRRLLWDQALSSLNVQDLIFGKGFESFRVNSAKFFSMSGGVGVSAHSVYVQMLYELGVPGLIVFVGTLGALLLWGFRARESSPVEAFCVVALTLAIALLCYSDNVLGYLVFNLYAWLLIGSLFGTASVRLEPKHRVASVR